MTSGDEGAIHADGATADGLSGSPFAQQVVGRGIQDRQYAISTLIPDQEQTAIW
jgi:hypothetical protein